MTACRALILRAEPAATRTAERLRAAGVDPIQLPLSATRFETESVRRVVDGRWGALAVTSGNAVRALASAGALPERFLRLPFFAVGARTALAARDLGFADVQVGPGDGVGLARFIAAKDFSGLPPLLYCTGEPRSEGFEIELGVSHVPHEAIVCYRTVARPVPADVLQRVISPGAIDAILFYSRAQASTFFRLVEASDVEALLGSVSLVCLSANVAEGIPKRFRHLICVADAASEDSLIAKLLHRRSSP